MLDYFNRRPQISQKSPLTRRPQISFGISIETPPEFQKPFTMISRQTFLSPYLSYEQTRKSKIPKYKVKEINPAWTKKVDINQIETERTFLKQTNHLGLLNPQSRYYKELSTGNTRFRLTKGQFTNFLERNHSKELFGPLVGMERDKSKSLLTKKQIAKKSYYKLSQNFGKLNNYRSRLSETKEVLDEKHHLQKTRFAFRQSFKKELEERKCKKVAKYVLPQLSRTFSNMNSTLKSSADSLQNLELVEATLLSNKSIERLHNLRDFTENQRYFTLDVKSKDWSKEQEGKISLRQEFKR